MKKFIAIMLAIAVAFFILDSAYYRLGWYIDLHPQQPVTTFVKTEGDWIYLDSGSGYEPFEIRGVNMGSGMPGKWATEFGIDKETYLRWFRYIKEMGANAYRCAHYPHNEATMDALDEMGILCMAENHKRFEEEFASAKEASIAADAEVKRLKEL